MRSFKKISFVIAILSVFIANAQKFQGKAYYQTKRSFEMKMDSTHVNDEMQKQLQEMVRKQFEKTYILTFNRNESIYKKEEELSKPNPGQGGIVIEINSGNESLYKNTSNKTYTKFKEDFGKKFLIVDSIESLKWDMTKETKMIGKYLCIKATLKKTVDDYKFDKDLDEEVKKTKEINIIAWYTPEIPVSNGPEMFGGLPGLILELHEDKMHYVCNKITLNPAEKLKLVAPTKGKKMNQKDFDALMEKKHKEMMENFKGGRKKGENSSSFSIFISD